MSPTAAAAAVGVIALLALLIVAVTAVLVVRSALSGTASRDRARVLAAVADVVRAVRGRR